LLFKRGTAMASRNSSAKVRNLALVTVEDFATHVGPDTPIIIPLGSIEQHGPHLPLATDAILAEELAKRLAEAINGYYVPVLPYGQVWSAKNFPGTFSIELNHLVAILIDIIQSLYRHKVRKIILLSGHIGNLTAMQLAARRVREKLLDLKILYFCYPQLRDVIRGVTETPLWLNEGFHAAEIETSLMLAVAPELCRMEKAPCEYPAVPPEYGFSPVRWDEISKTGVFGDARAATAEKGEILMDRWVQIMANIVKKAFVL